MRILITNDDSISSPVLLPLIQWARKLGEVTTVVPKYEQSGKSHSIELRHPFEVQKVELAPGIEAYTVDSAPADCVRYAVLGLKMEFDLVI
ncbi:MAG: 5'/3'-nucleotidase SurE, partial [Agathobacter sp.]